MKKINKLGEIEIQSIKDDFEKVMKSSFEIWGDANFRLPTDYTRGTINTAILESVCNYISSKELSFLKSNKTKIRSNYKALISDKVYYEAVSKSTGGKTKVLDRFRLAHEILNQGTV